MPLALTTVFADLSDPRIETANKLHPLTDILVIATCATIAGRWEQVAEYGRSKEAAYLGLPTGTTHRFTSSSGSEGAAAWQPAGSLARDGPRCQEPRPRR
jgi:hypothetical protein